jgi:16S rRNA (guanine(527)-N(7))-methyltransferase RsmG
MIEQLNAWQSLKELFNLNPLQIDLLTKYVDRLLQENTKTNLTGFKTVEDQINLNLADSLELTKYLNLDNKIVVDVGSGAGIPGIALAIATTCHMHLMEIREKRITFLKLIVNELLLKNVNVDERDWLTFLRTKKFKVDYYLARASLQPEELIKAFNYDQATIIYWAAADWQPSDNIKKFIVKDESYSVAQKERRLIFFANRK